MIMIASIIENLAKIVQAARAQFSIFIKLPRGARLDNHSIYII